MGLLSILNNGKERIEFVENRNNGAFLRGNLKSIFRGGTLGAVAGLIIGDGDPCYILDGLAVCAVADIFINFTRTFGLTIMYRYNPEEYQKHKGECYKLE